MNKLVIQDDEGKTTVVPLIRDEITIGRKEGNTIRLTERNVSRRHARIVRDQGDVAIEDLDSYNGVRVNGTRIQGRCKLAVSDRVQIGDYLIELKSDVAGATADGATDQLTQPIERVDAMATTPTPVIAATAAAAQPALTAVVDVNRPQGQQAFADTDPSGRAAPATPARLVILSSNFAGNDYELNKPAIVIGRTDDNDIEINHRSISRHHAKVVQENGRFAIVDLQSSNGVRVNGEEYGKVELRRGDMIDLGHVRFRFIEPGEDFLFGRDAQAVDISPSGGGKGMMFALLALLVVGGGIGIFALTRGGGGTETAAADNTSSANSDDSAASQAGDTNPGNAATKDSASANPVAAAGDNSADPVDDLLAKARSAIDAEQWADAKRAARKALTADAGNADAQSLLEQAEREAQNLVRYDKFKRAVGKKDFATVATTFADIEATSVYKDQARDDHDSLRADYTNNVVAQAKKLAAAGKCAEVNATAARADGVWSSAGDAARAAGAHCTVVASNPKRVTPSRNSRNKTSRNPTRTNKTNKPPKKTSKPPKTTKTSSNSGSSGSKSAAELTADARTAAKTGHWGKALRQCEAALSKKRGDQEAAMICALAACNIKSASKAKKYMSKLRSPSRKGMARQICLKNGVDIPIN